MSRVGAGLTLSSLLWLSEGPCEVVNIGPLNTRVQADRAPGCCNYRPGHRADISDTLVSPLCSQLFLLQYLMSSPWEAQLLHICVAS